VLDTAIDTDVLIVGAGPVGLFLANECARRGLRWRLVEARSTQSVNSAAPYSALVSIIGWAKEIHHLSFSFRRLSNNIQLFVIIWNSSF
jgi:2-polyprenyl-6-methoxyphenol hydroxylase-like FAD-dependent oxidoreductase